MRDISKFAIAQVKQFFKLCLGTIGFSGRASKKKNQNQIFNKKIFYIIIFFAYILMLLCIILEFQLYNCYNRQCQQYIEVYSDFSEGYSSFSLSVTNTLLMVNQENLTLDEELSIRRSVEQIYDEFIRNTWKFYSRGSSFCPLCTNRDFYDIYIPRGITYEKVFFNFIGEMMRVNRLNRSSPKYNQTLLSALQMYYFQIDMTFVGFERRLLQKNQEYLDRTRTIQLLIYFLYIFIMFITIAFLIFSIFKFDQVFYHIMMLLSRFPDSALPNDTLKILKQNQWMLKLDSLSFDSEKYNEILEALPDAVIVVDQTHKIILYNISANIIINTSSKKAHTNNEDSSSEFNESIIGESLFSVLKMNLFTIDEESKQKIPFTEIVNNYIYDNRDNAENIVICGVKDKQHFWFSLTILPIFEGNQVRQSNKFALIFRDIGDERRQQSLIECETEKHMSIIYQILPHPIAERLLKDQRSISMTVEKVAISFCDIVSFTPWCGSQTAEGVVKTLNHMFNLFDEYLSQYPTMTKIKSIGDCYMSAAGIFTPEATPNVFCTEMALFGLDMITAIGQVNKDLGTSLRIRVGAALGGPISAGVMGIHKPVFDIWGDAVNEANGLESGGVPMCVHINPPMYEEITKDLFIIEKREIGTYLIKGKALI